MKPSLFAAAFLFDDGKNSSGGIDSREAGSPSFDRAHYLAIACRDDPALRFRVADRAAFLARVCRDDPELRSRVEALLALDLAAESFLENSSNPGATPPSSGQKRT